MNSGTVIYNLLKDSATVGAVIGDKIYPIIAPPDVSAPYAVFSEFDQQPADTKDGPLSNEEDGFEINVYCPEVGQAKRLADAIKSVLSWYTGTVNTVIVDRIRFVTQTDELYDDEKELFNVAQQYFVRTA